MQAERGAGGAGRVARGSRAEDAPGRVPALARRGTVRGVAAPSIPYPSVWVEDDDLPRARELIAGRRASPGDIA